MNARYGRTAGVAPSTTQHPGPGPVNPDAAAMAALASDDITDAEAEVIVADMATVEVSSEYKAGRDTAGLDVAHGRVVGTVGQVRLMSDEFHERGFDRSADWWAGYADGLAEQAIFDEARS